MAREALPRDLNFFRDDSRNGRRSTVDWFRLAPGQYRGSVSLGFSDGSSQQVSVLFVVTPAKWFWSNGAASDAGF